MADGLRQDLPVSYKTTTLRTLIQALKAVFHHQTAGSYDYPEEQFRGLNIVTEWPLSRQQWPAIVVKFHEGQISNAGVGHEEEFQDDTGLTRKWMHRHFNGSVEFELLALSPYDLSVLSDALIEIVSFGKLNAVWELFYDKLYGNQQDPYSVLSLLYQINLNSDVINGSGMNVTPAPWQAEDSMVYTCSYDIELSGGFYNSIPPNLIGLGYVSEVDIESYLDAGLLPFNDDLDNGWTNPFIYPDDAEVVGAAVISGDEDYQPVAPGGTITIEPDALTFGPGGWNVNGFVTAKSFDTPACYYDQTLGLVTIGSENPQSPNVSYGPYVRRWNGSSWIAMGGALGDTVPSAYTQMWPCIIADSNGVPHAAWYEKVGPVAGGSTKVKKWNGAAWVAVGTPINHDNTVNEYAVNLVADNAGNLYLATMEADSSPNIYVQKWNGTTWADVGTQPLPVTASNVVETGWNASLAMIHNPTDDRISVAWSELVTPPRVRIAEFDGVNWNATNFAATSLEGVSQVFEVESVAFTWDPLTGKLVLALVTDEASTTSIHVITGSNGSWVQWKGHSRATNEAFSSTTCPIVLDANGSAIISYWGDSSQFGVNDNQRYAAWSDGDGAWIDAQITNMIDDQGSSANGPATAINGTDFYSVWGGRAAGGTIPHVWAKRGVIDDTN